MKTLSTVALSLLMFLSISQLQAQQNIEVTSAAANGPGTLSDILGTLNADASATLANPHTVTFNATLAGATINTNVNFTLQRPIVIDGSAESVDPDDYVTIQGGANFTINQTTASGSVLRNLSLLNPGAEGIRLENVSNVAVENFVISNAGGNGIDIAGTSSDLTFDGVDISGSGSNGIQLVNSNISSVDILNTYVYDNGSNGIYVNGNQISDITILGSIIGLDPTGAIRRGNVGHGLFFENGVTDLVIGGTNPSERNLISDNSQHGIFVESNVANVEIIGNYIGTDITGEINLGNDWNGLSVSQSTNIAIRNNVISGNGYNPDDSGPVQCNGFWGVYSGIGMQVSAQDIEITGNIIGLDKDGASALPNSNYGIWAGSFVSPDIQNVTIGGVTDDLRNIISSNGTALPESAFSGGCFLGHGIFMEREVTNLDILNNYIGTDISGTEDLGNRSNGVVIFSSNDVTIGGSEEGANLISGNGNSGIYLGDNGDISRNNVDVVVSHNFLGVLSDGTTSMGNDQHGITLVDQSGGRISENIISSNGQLGINLSNSSDATISKNLIGVAGDETTESGNTMGGIRIAATDGNASGNTISQNVIAYATGDATDTEIGNGFGIYVGGDDANQNYIDANLIYCNADLNISLAQDGPDFGTTGEGNDNKQTPTIDPALSDRNITQGVGDPGDTVQVFTNDPNCGCGGKVYLGATVVQADGTWAFDHTGNSVLAGDSNLVAITGTDGSRNTSQFQCKVPVAGEPQIDAVSTCDGQAATITLSDYFAAILVWEIASDAGFSNILLTDTTEAVAKPYDYEYLAPGPGTYHVRVTSVVDVGNTATSDVATFMVSELPTISSILADPASICLGENSTISVTTNATGSIAWFSRTAATEFAVINGQTASSTTQSPTEDTWYRALVTESSSAACQQLSDSVMVEVLPNITPSVTLMTDTADICLGGPLNFTANGIDIGSNATFQWTAGGVIQSETSAVFTASDLIDGDVVSVQVTVDTACASSPTVSDQLVLSLPSYDSVADDDTICAGETPTVTVSGTIGTIQWQSSLDNVSYTNLSGETNESVVSPLGETTWFRALISSEFGSCVDTTETIQVFVYPIVEVGVTNDTLLSGACQGDSVVFEAVGSDVGQNAAYQWLLNGSEVGDDSPFFSYSNYVDGDVLNIQVTVDTLCPSLDEVNLQVPLTISVQDTVTPSFEIEGNNLLCVGDLGTFDVTDVAHGGDVPRFNWYVNDTLTFTGSPFESTTLGDGDVVAAVMTSEALCRTQDSVESNEIVIQNAAQITPEIEIEVDTNDVCPGQQLVFEANVLAGGTNGEIIWYVNDVMNGSENPLTVDSYVAGDSVWASLISNQTCLSKAGDTSNVIVIRTLDELEPSVELIHDTNVVCEGTPIAFTTEVENGGDDPTFQWFVDGEPITGSGSSLTLTTLENGEQVTVVVTPSEEVCLLEPTASSSPFLAEIISKETPLIALDFEEDTICDEKIVTFDTASTYFLGDNPTFSYFINDAFVTDEVELTVDSLKDGDVVRIVATTSETCVTSEQGSDQVTINIEPLTEIFVSAVPDTNDACLSEDEIITFTAVSNVDAEAETVYRWTRNGSIVEGETSATLVLMDPQPNDQVLVQLTTDQECVVDSIVNSSYERLQFDYEVEAIVDPDLTIDQSQEVSLDGSQSTPEEAYQWIQIIDGDSTLLADSWITTQEVSAIENEFLFVVSNEFCADTATYQVFIDFDLLIPNVYSPNGDNNHDTWMITNIEKFPGVEVEIYNRWGSLVYKNDPGEGYNIDNAWDGTYEGTDVPDATYYYILKITDEMDALSGSVTVIR